MTSHEIAELREALVLITAYYGIQLQNPVIAAYAEDMAHLRIEDVRLAILKLRRDPKINRNNILPIPPKIIALVSPEVTEMDQARDVAARIITAMSRFGYTNPDRAQEFIGPLGWRVVQLQGGWTRLCQDTQISDNGILQAQLRDLAVSIGHKFAAGLGDTPAQLPSPTRPETQAISHKVSNLISMIEAKKLEQK